MVQITKIGTVTIAGLIVIGFFLTGIVNWYTVNKAVKNETPVIITKTIVVTPTVAVTPTATPAATIKVVHPLTK